MKTYPETNQQGVISIENFPEEFGLRSTPMGTSHMEGHFGIQIAEDGRVWVNVNGIAFLRFKAITKKGGNRMTVEVNEITREQFQAYEDVRKSGVTNMFDLRTVMLLSGLDRDTIIAIMRGYEGLDAKYPGVRK